MNTWGIATILKPPYVMKTESGYEGFMVDLLDGIGRQQGFKYVIKPTVDGQYGIKFPNGSWNGMIQDLFNYRAQIAAADLTITDERDDETVTFTRPFITESHRFLVQRPQNVPVSPNACFLLEPFSTEVWICILASIVIVTILFMLIGRFNPYEWRQVPSDKDPRGARHSFGLRESLMFVFSTLSLQGYRETPRSLAGRVLAVSWFIFVFLTIVTYISTAVAFNMTGAGSRVAPMPFNSLEDLLLHKDIQVGVIKNGSTYKLLKSSNRELHNRLADYIDTSKSYVSTAEEGADRVVTSNGRFIMMMRSLDAEYIAGRNCTLMVYGANYFPSTLVFATRWVRQPDTLTDTLNAGIVGMREDGVTELLRRKWWETDLCSKLDSTRQKGIQYTATTLDLRNMNVHFIILVAGTILAAIILVCEIGFKNCFRDSSSV